jgi:hypothetical protein
LLIFDAERTPFVLIDMGEMSHNIPDDHNTVIMLKVKIVPK